MSDDGSIDVANDDDGGVVDRPWNADGGACFVKG
jgi:hypothetical protein